MQNMQNMMEETWPNSIFPTSKTFSPFEFLDRMTDTRIPLCDVMDKGDKYEVTLEIPGIDKDKVDVKATKNSVTISGKQAEKPKKKAKIMFTAKDHTNHFTDRYLFLKKLYHQKLLQKLIMVF